MKGSGVFGLEEEKEYCDFHRYRKCGLLEYFFLPSQEILKKIN